MNLSVFAKLRFNFKKIVYLKYLLKKIISEFKLIINEILKIP